MNNKTITRIVAGWYFRGDDNGDEHEIVLNYKGESMFELSAEVVKVLVAQDMGYIYVEEIDFRYFDRSCNYD